MRRILVCEDEAAIRDFVIINLERAGYLAVAAENGQQGEQLYIEGEKKNEPFDIVLLDIMMPGIDGTELCKRLRKLSAALGIIMLTAKTREFDKVNCLMLGADDYITKPFSPSELVARVDAVYRRVSLSKPQDEDSTTLNYPPFSMNLKSRTVTKNGQAIELTGVEFHILEYFIKNPDIALDRKSILSKIWGENYYGDEKIVDVNVRRLRMKIEDDPSTPAFIHTVWGFGYRWGE